MAKRHLLSSTGRGSFFDIPSDMASLERYYVLATDDLDLISSRRGAENRLGLAIHIALLRYPGQGWRDSDQIPPEVIHWLSEQIHVSTSALDIYGHRESTRAAHRVLAIEHLGLRPFLRADFRIALELATQAAFGTDEGSAIMGRLLAGSSEVKLVYPGTVTLERIGLAGRARARRLAAQDLNDALNVVQQAALQDLLIKDPSLGISRLAWLRSMPHSTSVASLPGDLERQIGAFVDYYNTERYHESLNNVTPADVYFGRDKAIIREREKIKRLTIQKRRLQHQKQAA